MTYLTRLGNRPDVTQMVGGGRRNKLYLWRQKGVMCLAGDLIINTAVLVAFLPQAGKSVWSV